MQFGFSATDVKLKQWDETPKLAATQTFSPTEISSGTQMPSHYLPRHPFITETFAQTAEWKHILLGKIAASLKPFPKVGKYQPGMDAHAFSEENQVFGRALGGLSAAGERTGVSSNSDSSPPQIEYIPRQLLKKTMRQYGLATEDIRYGQHDWGMSQQIAWWWSMSTTMVKFRHPCHPKLSLPLKSSLPATETT